jgi:hypothetical protein
MSSFCHKPASEIVTQQTPKEAHVHEEEYSNPRHREYLERRLRDRWKCKVNGHTYCFTGAESVHLQLTDDDIKEWVDKMVGRI